MAATVAHVWPAHSHPVFTLPFPGRPGLSGRISPLMIADRLITLAQDADRAGYPDTASQIVSLVYTVLDSSPVS